MAQVEKKIQFVSLISRNDVPLYIQSFDIGPVNSETTQDANKLLKYNFLSHMALDIFASPSSTSLREQQQDVEENGGAILLFIHDEITVYGYETNTGLKIVVGFGLNEKSSGPDGDSNDDTDGELDLKELKGSVTESGKESAKDSAKDAPTTKRDWKLKDLFSQLHKCYIRTICNPFTTLTGNAEDHETILQSAKFDTSIGQIVGTWNDI